MRPGLEPTPATTPERKALTTGEIARYCGVNFLTVIRWIDRGQLRGYRLPGRGDHRVRVAEFLDFLRENGMPVPEDLRLHPARALIVDDEPRMAAAIARALRAAGFETHVASDGFEAGAELGTLAPELMTLDLRMPGLDGFRVLELVRGNPRLARVKILVVSALGPSELERARKAGADDCLEKPFENRLLLEKAQRLTGLRPRKNAAG